MACTATLCLIKLAAYQNFVAEQSWSRVDQIPPSAAFGFLPRTTSANWLNQEWKRHWRHCQRKCWEMKWKRANCLQLPPPDGCCAQPATAANWLHPPGGETPTCTWRHLVRLPNITWKHLFRLPNITWSGCSTSQWLIVRFPNTIYGDD